MGLTIATQQLNFAKSLQVSKAKTRANLNLSVKVDKQDLTLLEQNMKVLRSLFAIKVARALQAIGADLLTHAQPRVPVDKGQLRESGRVDLIVGSRRWKTAKGNKDGTINANITSYKASELAGAKRLKAVISYTRFNERGEDIGLWCHEVLRPQEERVSKEKGSGISYAKTEGTGPKYLELPFYERKQKYIAFAENMLSPSELAKDIVLITKVMSSKSGKYTVNRIKLVKNQIDRLGYFGGIG